MNSDVAGRILVEVMRGILVSSEDSEEEKQYRVDVARDVRKITQSGGVVETPKELCDFTEE